MIRRLRRLLREKSPKRDALGLTASNLIAQAITFSAIPLLTRLFGPADYGIAAIFVAIVLTLSAVLSGRFEFAIPIAESDQRAAVLCLISSTVVVTLTFLIGSSIIYWRSGIEVLLEAPGLAPWLLLIPIALLFVGGYGIANYWATRKSSYGKIGIARISESGVTAVTQISLGLMGVFGAGGLVLGRLIGSSVGTAILLIKTIKEVIALIAKTPDLFAEVKSVLIEYRHLPKYALQTGLLNSISSSASILLLSHMLGVAAAGFFGLAQRILMTPIMALTGAIWQVGHGRMGQLDGRERVILVRKLHRWSCYAFAFPLLAVSIFSEVAVAIFGEKWADLESILPWFGVMVYFNAVSNTTSYWVAFGRYRAEMITNVLLFSLRLTALLLGAQFGVLAAIGSYATVSIIAYLSINVFWGIKTNSLMLFGKNYAGATLLSVVLLIPVQVASRLGMEFGLLVFLLCAAAYYTFYLQKILSVNATSQE